MDQTRFYDTCSYCTQTLVAATWHQKLAQRLGEMAGNEGIVGNEKGDKTPYTGWYAPGVNIRRSPFGGRNFEYYSEDGILSGKIAAAQIRGCNSKGVVTFVKHFAANERETHRSISGDSSWMTEQALREIFLRPFELAVKEGPTAAVMTPFNRTGTRWTGGGRPTHSHRARLRLASWARSSAAPGSARPGCPREQASLSKDQY